MYDAQYLAEATRIVAQEFHVMMDWASTPFQLMQYMNNSANDARSKRSNGE